MIRNTVLPMKRMLDNNFDIGAIVGFSSAGAPGGGGILLSDISNK
jgi:hypothetical protein